jgi:hypothetical protein
MSEPLLSVVEELKNLQISDFSPKMDDAAFWGSNLPISGTKLQNISPGEFSFETHEVFTMDQMGMIQARLDAVGSFHIEDKGEHDQKAHVWEISGKAKTELTEVKILVRLRAKNTGSHLKVGVYLYQLDFDLGILQGFGKDAIYFVARQKIRDFLMNIQMKMKK